MDDAFVEFDDDAFDDENSFLEGTSNGLIDEFVEFDDGALDDENSFLEGTSKGRTLYDEITASEEPPWFKLDREVQEAKQLKN